MLNFMIPATTQRCCRQGIKMIPLSIQKILTEHQGLHIPATGARPIWSGAIRLSEARENYYFFQMPRNGTPIKAPMSLITRSVDVINFQLYGRISRTTGCLQPLLLRRVQHRKFTQLLWGTEAASSAAVSPMSTSNIKGRSHTEPESQDHRPVGQTSCVDW